MQTSGIWEEEKQCISFHFFFKQRIVLSLVFSFRVRVLVSNKDPFFFRLVLTITSSRTWVTDTSRRATCNLHTTIKQSRTGAIENAHKIVNTIASSVACSTYRYEWRVLLLWLSFFCFRALTVDLSIFLFVEYCSSRVCRWFIPICCRRSLQICKLLLLDNLVEERCQTDHNSNDMYDQMTMTTWNAMKSRSIYLCRSFFNSIFMSLLYACVCK